MLTIVNVLQLVLLVGVAVVAGGVIGIRVSSAQRAKAQRDLVHRAFRHRTFYQVVPVEEYAAAGSPKGGDR